MLPGNQVQKWSFNLHIFIESAVHHNDVLFTKIWFTSIFISSLCVCTKKRHIFREQSRLGVFSLTTHIDRGQGLGAAFDFLEFEFRKENIISQFSDLTSLSWILSLIYDIRFKFFFVFWHTNKSLERMPFSQGAPSILGDEIWLNLSL